jgi:hypothetical protein
MTLVGAVMELEGRGAALAVNLAVGARRCHTANSTERTNRTRFIRLTPYRGKGKNVLIDVAMVL